MGGGKKGARKERASATTNAAATANAERNAKRDLKQAKKERKRSRKQLKRQQEQARLANAALLETVACLTAQLGRLVDVVHAMAGELKETRLSVTAELKETREAVVKELRSRAPNRPPPQPPAKRAGPGGPVGAGRVAAQGRLGPFVPMEIPPHRKLLIYARYKAKELTFHEQLWREMGMEVTRDMSATDWTVRWSMRVPPDDWARFQSWQKTNYLPGVHSLIRKDNLHRSITAMQRRFGQAAFDFWPTSFNLPEEWALFQEFAALHPTMPWILKPPAASCGRKIVVFPSAADIAMAPSSPWMLENRPLAQQYTDTPLLGGHKFTFRIYVVLTGVDPLRVYMYKDGLARIASRKYSKEKSSFSDLFVHLDSVDINVNNAEAPSVFCDGLETEGLRSSVRRVLAYFERTKQIASAQALWDDICSVVVRSVLCAEHEMLAAVRKYVRWRPTCFDLLGYDILLDEQFKPWILEINHSPSMAPMTAMENVIKQGMLRDYFALGDLTLAHREPLRDYVQQFVRAVQQRRAAGEVEYTLDDFVAMHHEQSLQVTRLSEADVYTLVNAWMEDQRKGGFERVFPSADMLQRYGAFYKHNRNTLHQVWMANQLSVAEFLDGASASGATKEA